MKLPGTFCEISGIPEHIQSMENITPLQLFRLFYTEDLLEIISFQTNLYAAQTSKNYKPTTPEEIDVFLALNLVVGIKKLPSYKDYWASAPDFMPLNRFGWLLNHIHLNDNSLIPSRENPNFDKLYKIRPLLNIIQRNFRANYKRSEKVAVDESMIKFKGRSSLKQYMPKKPIKRGYKVWMKCAEPGYCLDFQLYTSKQEHNVEKIWIDLLNDKILACGTVNATRKHLPTLKEDTKLERGEHDYRVSDTNVTVMKWKDKRVVHLLSNYHDSRNVSTVIRKERNGDSNQIACPELVKDYNANMNFVDKFAQLKSCYAIERKSRKWWHRIFFNFLDCALVNSFVIYKDLQKLDHTGLSRLTIKEFRLLSTRAFLPLLL
ncbi:unnamed protein product [Parnassius apollo]|uniref:(apollo) hypothetical protein n=1 Tax=Parnassius apollo TaxID=110799 RepID=A0A8S3W9N2_PARAO|nr:unnamed protein product [Parnassius apollo]